MNENRCIDLVATDPHYGVFENGRDSLDLRYIPLSYALLKEPGAIFSFASQKRLLDFLLAFSKTDFKWQNNIVWFYRNGFARESRKFVIKYDPILFYSKGEFAINTDAVRVPYISTERLKYDCNNSKKKGWRPNPLGSKMGDVWEVPAITSLRRFNGSGVTITIYLDLVPVSTENIYTSPFLTSLRYSTSLHSRSMRWGILPHFARVS